MVRDARPFRIRDWNDWVRTETSEPVPGALAYVNRARKRGVRVFYVTNRTAEVEAETLATLGKLGFPVRGGLDDLLTQNERPEWGEDKSSRRAFLCASHRILQIVGDNLNDFTSGARTTPEARTALAERYADHWGTRWIVMPNPAYGGWEGALRGFERGLSRREVLRRKYEQLQTTP
jgi:acid phosphatase